MITSRILFLKSEPQQPKAGEHWITVRPPGHEKGQPVLVAGTHDSGRPTLTVVTPPARPRIVDPERNWFRARGEGNAYLPWWGLRRDADWSRYTQGFSD